MAFNAKKTEHAGHKGSGRKGGHWGTRVEAKTGASKSRRAADKAACKEA